MTWTAVVAGYAMNALWQAPVVAGAAWLAARAVRGLGPGAEHRAWVAGLAAQCALPALALVEWRSAEAWLEAWFAALGGSGTDAADAARVAVTQGAGVAAHGLALPAWAMGVLAVAYGVATGWLALRLGWRLLQLRRLRSEALVPRLTPEATQAWEEAKRRFGVTAELRVAPGLTMPAAMGVWWPLVLIPEGLARELDAVELETVLAHECAHVARRDFAKNAAYELAAIAVGWHPAVWWVRGRVTETREMVCDALAAGVAGRSAYGRCLLRLAERLAGRGALRTPLATGIFDSDGLEGRLMRLTEATKAMRGARRAAAMALCAALGTGTLAFALGMGVHVAPPAAAAAEQGAKPVEVPAGKMVAYVDHKVQPTYPPEAKKARVQGTVKLKATIAKDGTIEDLRVVSGPEKLQQSALDAVKQWTYKPYLLNGEPVEVETTINVIYTLGRKAKK